jgi:anti-sigma factor ChrR (cupin superfamily)
MVTENLNGDLSKRVVMRTGEMEWAKSGPSATVERKRCFRAGPQESGSVTSIVRYLPGATFPKHPHPQGEEIFILEGLFCDERGNHGPGTFLLNPEGFEHAPSSPEGNLILVRLRQYTNAIPGVIRSQVALNTNALPWTDEFRNRGPGVSQKLLYPLPEDSPQNEYPEIQWLEKWNEVSSPTPFIVGTYGLELFVVDGKFRDSDGSYKKGDWMRFPAGHNFDGTLNDKTECVLLFKSGGLKYAIPDTPDLVESH